jgi:hypothetical protein
MGIWLGPRGRAAYAAEGKGFFDPPRHLRASVIGSDHRGMVLVGSKAVLVRSLEIQTGRRTPVS